MQTQRIENIDVQDNIIQPLFLAKVERATAVKIDGSPKAAFRKFAAENALQPKAQFEQSLTDRFKSGSLQEDVLLKKINPHTLIHKAILENSPDVIRFLLAQGVNVDYPDENMMTPLTMAILNRCNHAVEALLANGANINPQVKWNGMNLLELAISMKDRVSTNLLLQKGADVNAKTKKGKGILSMALDMAGPHGGGDLDDRKDWANIAKNMINFGANVNSCEAENAPLFDAIFAVHFGVDASLLEFMLAKGANPNMAQLWTGDNFRTPLLYVSLIGRLDFVKLLVESGADVNKSVKSYAGVANCTPLKLALDQGHAEIVQYLLQHGARA